MWFGRFRPKRIPRKFSYKPTLERLEDRTVPTATWNNFGGDAQHTDVAQVAAQPIDQLLWQMPLDLAPWGDVHYGDPIFTQNNVVVVPIKVTWDANNQGATNFIEAGINDVTGAVVWSTAPMGSITGASNVGSTIVITTNNTNGLADGDYVTIGDMRGDTAANTGSSDKTYQVSNVTSTSFTLNGVAGNGTYTGGGLWVLSTTSSTATSYIEPKYNWLPPDQAAYDPVTDRVYFPGPGGTIDYISNPDTATGVVTPVQKAFYGISNYTNNPSAYNASIYINTPLTVDSQGNIYFGYAITGSNPSNITEGGIAQISASGTATNVAAFAAADTAGQAPSDNGNWVAALGSAPALSNDESIVFFAVDDGGYGNSSSSEHNAYLVGLNSSTLQPQYSVRLYDPTSDNGVPATGVQTSGNGADLIDESTASPMVAPDDTIYMGVFGSSYDGSRGSLLHFSGNLQTEYTPGAFGWDDTASIIPTSMVPSYSGSSSYLILSKYNNYANAETGSSGGNGVNEIAVLDPYASQPDPNNDPKPGGQTMPVMKQILTMASPSPDIPNINGGNPDAVREWCTNGTAVDPTDDSIFVNNEDGYTYEWNLGTNTITHTVEVSKGVGVPYTPTAISPNGEVFSDNGGMLFALGGYSNYSITTVSSANPAVYGTPFTLTTSLASTSGGPTPTGTITYTAYAGANNPLNYITTPIQLGTATLNSSGVATLTISATQLLAAHYHITASYSGDSNYSAGQTTISLPVLETVTTAVSASGNPEAKGTSVTFTATMTPNGTSSTVVQNGTGSSSYFVPIGTVTFMDGSTVLWTVNLNSLEQGGPNGNGTYPSSYIQQVTFTTSSLPMGTHAIMAVYSGDQNFAGGTSAVYDESVVPLATYVVTSTADDGSTGTLRDAINQVNAGNYTEIDFHIPGTGVQTINLTSTLPAIRAGGDFINGQSEDQFQGVTSSSPLIVLNGSSAGSNSDGLLLQGSNDIISGLILEHFNNGIEVAGANNTIGGAASGARNILSANTNDGLLIDSSGSGNQVLGNYIGTNSVGTAALPNSGNGIEIQGAGNTVGGSSGSRNVISGNTHDGVKIDSGASGNQVLGNAIGVNTYDSAALGNSGNGIEVAGSNNTLGASYAVAPNEISGNSNDGVLLDSSSSGNQVLGDYIGTNHSGTASVANKIGIEDAGSSNTLGGSVLGAKNVISGNSSDGVLLDSTADAETMQGNYIGLNVGGNTVLANGTNGLEVQGNNNTIGGASGSNYYIRNFISGNNKDGVLIDSSATGNSVLGNFVGLGVSGTQGVSNLNGIEIAGNSNTIGGTSSTGANVLSGNKNDGILLDSTASANLIQGNDAGTDFTGQKAVANSIGIEVAGAGNTLGGTVSAARNLVSGNSSDGVKLDSTASGTLVIGNSIGVNSVDAALANSGNGLNILSTTNTIGGTASGSRNVISANSGDGLLLASGASGNQVLGNYIGTNIFGTAALGNSSNGIDIASNSNTIGGTTSAARNVISGNSSDGVLIDSTATGNSLQGNYNGTNAAGTASLANSIGVEMAGNNNTVGGSSGSRNVISGNAKDGVKIDSGASGNQVLGNAIGVNTYDSAAVGNSGNGIEVAGSSNTLGASYAVAPNEISGNSNDGVLLDSGSSGNQVLGNYIGTNHSGTASVANKVGIEDAGSSNTLGGSVLGAKNVISGNSSDGVLLDSTANAETMQGNYIGLNVGGNTILANGSHGVEVQGSNNTLGGNSGANYFARNFISGNKGDGVLIDSGASGDQVLGNFIGVGVSGTNGVGNTLNGIEIAGNSNTIGGTVSGNKNVVSGNRNDGVLIDSTATNSLIQGNYVGTDYTGQNAVANSGNGIEIQGTSNTVGGIVSGAGNIISGNSKDGVLVSAGSGDTIRRNSIFTNAGGGISLSPDTNNNIAAPSLSSATLSGSMLTVQGSFTAPTPNVSYVLEFFANPSGDPEGKIYLGSLTVMPTTTGTQPFTFTATTSVTGTYPLITATLTDAAGDTSDFSSGITMQ